MGIIFHGSFFFPLFPAHFPNDSSKVRAFFLPPFLLWTRLVYVFLEVYNEIIIVI